MIEILSKIGGAVLAGILAAAIMLLALAGLVSFAHYFEIVWLSSLLEALFL